MGFELGIFEDKLDADYLDWLVDEQWVSISRHFNRLWQYYANPMVEIASVGVGSKQNESSRCYVQAQEWGLPARITGLVHLDRGDVFAARPIKDIQRKEVVIENDIGWRINAAVDFLFGKPISFVSRSPNSQKRPQIEAIIKAVFGANGGIGFFQDMAVLGAVYGFCLL